MRKVAGFSVSPAAGFLMSVDTRREELLQGVDAVPGEGGRPVLVGDAQHENATVLVGHLLRHEAHELLRHAEPRGHFRSRQDDVHAGQRQAA